MVLRPRSRRHLDRRHQGDELDGQAPRAAEDDSDDPIPDPLGQRGALFWIIFSIVPIFTLFWLVVFAVLALR